VLLADEYVASRNGLGRHLITVTPEESVGLEKVGRFSYP